jgi:membrane protease YdiL (CAAX protease family)
MLFRSWSNVTKKTKHQDAFILLLVLALLLCTPINTDISPGHFIYMSVTLGLAIYLPYLVYKKNKLARIQFHFKLDSGWGRRKFSYIALGGIVGYLLFPFYFQTTGAYQNWPGPNDPTGIFLLFAGTNALGIWDELFFVNTLLGIFRRYMGFWQANILQAALWTIFLFELGFVGWIPPIIFFFAMLQGYTYKLFHSLGFLIAIHLTIDFMLFLAILDAHDVLQFTIFIT